MAYIFFLLSIFRTMGVGSEWIIYYPSLSGINAHPATDTNLAMASFCIAGISSILVSFNFFVTISEDRIYFRKSFYELPLFVWSIYIASGVMLFAIPIVAIRLFLMFIGFFSPSNMSMLFYPKLFWVFVHAIGFLLFIPSVGLLTHIIQSSTKGKFFKQEDYIIAIVSFGGLGFILWTSHVLVVSTEYEIKNYFLIATQLIAAHIFLIFFAWIISLLLNNGKITIPVLFALGYILFLTLSTMILIANTAVHYKPFGQDTDSTIFIFHQLLGIGSAFSMFGGFYTWFNKLTGLTYSEFLSKLHFWTFFFGVFFTFFPMPLIQILNTTTNLIKDYPYVGSLLFEVSNVLGSSFYDLSIFIFIVVIIESLNVKRLP